MHSDLAADDDKRVIAVWDMNSEEGLAVYYAESKDQGLSWSKSKRLSKQGYRATHPKTVFSNSRFLAVWTQSNDGKKQSVQMQQL